jgi:hypothetical protein
MSLRAQGVGGQQLLFKLENADLTLTTDQAFTMNGNFAKYIPTRIWALTKSGAYGVACLGGIYPAASKAGTPLVAATQSFVALSAANKIVQLTNAAVLATDVQTATPIFALTTGNTGALVADLYIFGDIVD